MDLKNFGKQEISMFNTVYVVLKRSEKIKY